MKMKSLTAEQEDVLLETGREKHFESKTYSHSELVDLGRNEITKLIRQQLKEEFPKCKFSITQGQKSIHISLIKSNFKVLQKFIELSNDAIYNYTEYYGNRTLAELECLVTSTHFSLGHFHYNDVYNANNWSNGTFLTEQGFDMFKRISMIANQYNWDNSDIQTDYFDVNFYLNLSIGKWDKPFTDFAEEIK